MARFVNRDVVVVPLPLTDFSEGRRKRQFGRAASSSLPEIAFVPKGRLSLDPTPLAVPSGRVPFSQLDPTLSRWAVAKCPSGTIPNLYSELDAALAIRGDSS